MVVEVDMVKKAVTELKNGRAPGPENIPAELIKCGTDKLFLALTWCMNKYINGVTPPSLWKVAYISSIHKKGNKLDCSNYRGISVTSTLSRVFGRILRNLIEIGYRDKKKKNRLVSSPEGLAQILASI
ncbi:uncharacterized protein [Diabrotica undecimpunctata]|uniref:uncharacterized protein n=1 Tax=Diabrotica undecimpunctata TaxID=50387 RepID=UPI003B632FA2